MILRDTEPMEVISSNYGGYDRESYEAGMDAVLDKLYALPVIDSERLRPVKYGKWIEYDNKDDKGYHYCSECGKQAFNYCENGVTEILSNYCPNCGAKMDVGLNE